MEAKLAQRNIYKLFVIRAIRSGMFSISIIMLFFRQNGISVQEAIMLQVLFSFAALAFEMPTGHFADQYGRKKSIIYGSIFSTCGYISYSFAYGFWDFLFAEVVLALGCSFVSGADSAMLYELQQDLKDGGAIKNEGAGAYYGQLSEGITSFIGGSMLALISLRLPICFDAALAFLAFPVAFTLVESDRKPQERRSIIVVMWQVMKYSLHEHAEIKWLIISSAIVGAATLNMVWFIQMYWVDTHVPIEFFGVLWAMLLFTSAITSLQAHRIEKLLGRRLSLFAIIIMPVIGYALLSTTMKIWSGIFILFFYLTRGMNDPITKSYINGLVSSDDRAKILSVRNFVSRLMFCCIGSFAGYLHDAVSIRFALAVSGSVFFFVGLVALFFLHKHKAL